MKIAEQAAKFMNEYQGKIEDCDTLITNHKLQSKGPCSEIERVEAMAFLRELNAKRQAYLQAQKDFEEIFQYAEFKEQ